MYQVLARKYRPQKFSEVIGQEHITRTLQNAISEGRLHHAYLLTGIRGIGKTTLARVFSKLLNCKEASTSPPEPCNKCPSCIEITNGSSIDVQEIDGASNNGVENVRDIRERVKFLPATGKYKIYIIDEVHMLSGPAFNALLKTLEEPPAHVIFIFATTEAQKIPATILSRCQRYDFRRISTPKIIETLKEIAKAEGVTSDDDSLEIIAVEAEGSMRDAESLFDQAIACAGKKLTYEHLKSLLGFLDRKQLNDAIGAIVERNARSLLSIGDELFNGGENLGRFMNELLESFHTFLLIKSCNTAPEFSKSADVKLLKELAPKVTTEECQQWFNILYHGSDDIARSKFPKMVMDVILIRLTEVRPVYSIDELVKRLDNLGKNDSRGDPPLHQPAGGQERSPATRAGAEPRPYRSDTIEPDLKVGTTENGWDGFLDWLKLNKPQVASFLEMSTGGRISDSTLVIAFRSRSFASERLLEADRKAFIEKLAADYFKRPMKMDLEFATANDDSAAQEKKKNIEQTHARQKEIKEEAFKHEMVKNAANIFGAEIKDIKVK